MSNTPPCYADMGKSARDIFGKGYNYGFFKLDVKTKTLAHTKINICGSQNQDTQKSFFSGEHKYTNDDYGLTLSEKLNTDNVLESELTLEDQIAKGLKLTFDTSFAPNTGKKTGRIKTGYKRDYLNLNCDVDFDFAGPTINGASVLGFNGWLAGYQMSFDTSKSKLTKSNFAVGYSKDDLTLHTSVNDGTEFSGSIHHQVKDDLEFGVQMSWTAGTNATRFSVGAKYCPEKDITYRAKVNNSSQIGCSYQLRVRDGVTLTVSSLLEGKSFNQGGHKVGLGLELEP